MHKRWKTVLPETIFNHKRLSLKVFLLFAPLSSSFASWCCVNPGNGKFLRQVVDILAPADTALFTYTWASLYYTTVEYHYITIQLSITILQYSWVLLYYTTLYHTRVEYHYITLSKILSITILHYPWVSLYHTTVEYHYITLHYILASPNTVKVQ